MRDAHRLTRTEREGGRAVERERERERATRSKMENINDMQEEKVTEEL